MEALPELFGPVDALPWTRDFLVRAEEQRRASRGQLFIDLLIQTCLGQVHELYPPKGPAGLRLLLKQINAAPLAATFLKRCIELYLLFDYGDEARVTEYARQTSLPDTPYVSSVMGYHLLDEGRLEDAVGPLASAGDDIEFKAELFARLAQSSQALVAYLRMATPAITEPVFMLECARASTSQGSLAEAWTWVRKLPLDLSLEPNRVDGIRVVLGTAFGDNGAASKPVPAVLRTLLSYPFEVPGEDQAVWEYCSNPPKSMSSKSRDVMVTWAVSRLSAEARYTEAISLLENPALAASTAEATAQRQLLQRSLESVISPIQTSVDVLLRGPQPPESGMETDVDLAAIPWSEARSSATAIPPKSLIEAHTQQRSAREQNPSAPAPVALPPSATPARRSILPNSASPFRPPGAQHSALTSNDRGLASKQSPGVFPAPSAREHIAPASSTRAPDIAPLGPRRPHKLPEMPITVQPRAPSPPITEDRRQQTREERRHSKQAEPVQDSAVALKRSTAISFPGAFDAMEEDGHEEETVSAPAAKRQVKASRSKTTANLAAVANADEEDESRPARTKRSKTATNLAMQANGEENTDGATPRRSKRLSVQPRTASPEVARPSTRSSPAKKSRGKAKE